MAKNTLLFVYGSLLKGESDHSFLRHSDCLGPSTTKVGYRLVELGAFPALIETGDKAIEGELYSVTHEDLMAIDAHKELGRLFQRRAVELASGQLAQVYLMEEAQVRGRRRVKANSWRDRFATPRTLQH